MIINNNDDNNYGVTFSSKLDTFPFSQFPYACCHIFRSILVGSEKVFYWLFNKFLQRILVDCSPASYSQYIDAVYPVIL